MISVLPSSVRVLSGHGSYKPLGDYKEGDIVVSRGGRICRLSMVKEGPQKEGMVFKTRRWHSLTVAIPGQKIACTDGKWHDAQLVHSLEKKILPVPDVKINPVLALAPSQGIGIPFSFASGYVIGTYLAVGGTSTINFSSTDILFQFMFYYDQAFPKTPLEVAAKHNSIKLDPLVISMLQPCAKTTLWIAAGFASDPLFVMGTRTGLSEHMRSSMHINLTTHLYEVLLITNMLVHPWDTLEHNNRIVHKEDTNAIVHTTKYSLDTRDSVLVADNMWVCGGSLV